MEVCGNSFMIFAVFVGVVNVGVHVAGIHVSTSIVYSSKVQ